MGDPPGLPRATPRGWFFLGGIDPPGGMVLFLGGMILFFAVFLFLGTPGMGTTPPGPENTPNIHSESPF